MLSGLPGTHTKVESAEKLSTMEEYFITDLLHLNKVTNGDRGLPGVIEPVQDEDRLKMAI